MFVSVVFVLQYSGDLSGVRCLLPNVRWDWLPKPFEPQRISSIDYGWVDFTQHLSVGAFISGNVLTDSETLSQAAVLLASRRRGDDRTADSEHSDGSNGRRLD